MINFITSDLHLGHGNIIKYCKRPFKDVDEMNRKIIHNWNQRVKLDDVVYHVGDFCFRRGIEGSKTPARDWEDQLNGKIIHVRGNHDKNNGVKTLISQVIIEFANLQFLLVHIPPFHIAEIPDFVDVVLCGHIHEKWRHKYYKQDTLGIPLINVGVDQWKFMPITMSEVVLYYYKILKGKI